MLLDSLRRGAASWVAKVLLGILAISFAFWGIPETYRRITQGDFASVGGTEITANEFQRAYQMQLEQMARQFGRRPTPDQARLLQLDARVLAYLIQQAAVDQHARELHLGLSDQAVIDDIQHDPALQGPDGRFSRGALDNILRQLGLGERGYIAQRRKEEVREQLTQALLGEVAAPGTFAELLHQYRDETRVIRHFTIDPAKAVHLPEPTEEQLRATYEANKKQLATPEYRKIGVLTMTAAEVKKRVEVTEESLKTAYEHDKARYDTPERRRVQQIAFKERAAAEKAARDIAAGKSFLEAAREAGAGETDVDLGMVSRAQLLDPKVAEAAFGLPKDKVSGVIDGRFGPVVLRVTEIVPERKASFDDVKAEVRDRLAGEMAADEIRKLQDQIEDNRSAGKSLSEIAQMLELKFEEAEIDRAGKRPDGNAAFEGPDAQRIVEAAFSAEEGVERDAIETADNGYAWVDVLKVIPEQDKPFEAVKDKVEALWTANETRKAVGELAAKLVDRANNGEPLAKLAQEAGGTVATTEPLTRLTAYQGLSNNAVAQAFILAKGAAASADSADGRSRTIIRVMDIVPAPAASQEQTERLTADMRRQMQADLYAQYIAALEARYGVSINQAAVRRAVGGSSDQ